MYSSHDHICLAFYIPVLLRKAVQLLRHCAYDDEETSHSTHSLLHSHSYSKVKGVANYLISK